MSGDESEFVSVAPALSTAQSKDTFTLQKYQSSIKERASYLGPHSSTDEKSFLSQYYAVKEIVQYLDENEQFRNITLQFPDSLVQDASIVSQLLQESLHGTDRRVWVLADTAYSACCVDEVASEHVKGDLVIHFGDACLNAVQSLPVLYSFGRPYLDLHLVVEKFKEIYQDRKSKICLMANAPYTYNLKPLCDELEKHGFENLIFAMIDDTLTSENSVILQQEHMKSMPGRRIGSLGNRVILTNSPLLGELAEESLKDDYALFHITIPQDPQLLFLTTQFNYVALYDPESDAVETGPYPSLMKRYKNMHVARTAGCIGILVNTLSLRNTKETINTLIKLIRNSGKKHYLFVVGKPNVAKLANFEPVDVWCILGCGQGGIILDQYNEFYKPIVTPYELTMALKEEVTWTGQWLVDFEEVLNEIENEKSNNSDDSENSTPDSYEPEFDAVTGKYVSTSRPLRQIRHLKIEGPEDGASQSLTQRVNGGVIIKGTVSTAAAQMQNREWMGLGSDFASQFDYEEDGATVEEGASGVASSYQFDKSSAN